MCIVTYTDYGDTCDGHARLLGSYETDEKAELEVFKDMDRYAKEHNNAGDSLDFRSYDHEVWLNGNVGAQGCVWDIHEVKDAIPTSVF
jgi:hypothetical protein